MKVRLALLVLGLAWLLAGCSSPEREPVLLTVGEQEITLAEFQRAFDRMVEQDENFAADSASARRFLRQYVDKTLMEQMARDSIPWYDAFQERLTFYEDQLAVQALHRDVFQYAAVEIPEEDLRSLYEKAATSYNYRAIPCRNREQAERTLRLLREGADFVEIARGIRDARGAGEANWRSALVIGHLMADTLATLEPGEIGGPVMTSGVFLILKLEDRAPNENRPSFEDAREAMQQALAVERVGNLRAAYEEQLFETYDYQLNMDEIEWMTGFLREKTATVSRTFDPSPEAPRRDEVPWSECPLPEDEWSRPLATMSVDTLTAIHLVNFMLTKLIFTWPTFEHTEDAIYLLRELALRRLEPVEARARGYDQDPDVAWHVERRRNLMYTRQFYEQVVKKRTRPSVAEAEAWFATHAAEFGTPEAHRYLSIAVHDWQSAVDVMELLKTLSDPQVAFARAQGLDSLAFWNGPQGVTIHGREAAGPFYDLIMSLEEGEVSEPIVSRQGKIFTVVRIEELRQAMIPTFEDVAGEVVERLGTGRADSLLNVYLQERRANTPVVIDEEVFGLLRYDAEAEQGS